MSLEIEIREKRVLTEKTRIKSVVHFFIKDRKGKTIIEEHPLMTYLRIQSHSPFHRMITICIVVSFGRFTPFIRIDIVCNLFLRQCFLDSKVWIQSRRIHHLLSHSDFVHHIRVWREFFWSISVGPLFSNYCSRPIAKGIFRMRPGRGSESKFKEEKLFG